MFNGLKRFFTISGVILLLSMTFPAFAEAGGQGVASAGMGQLFILGGFVLIFYFLMWRPQSKRAKEQRALIASLAKDDEVITTGGILGRVIKVTDNFLVLSIAEETEIRLQKNAIAASLPKGSIKAI